MQVSPIMPMLSQRSSPRRVEATVKTGLPSNSA